MHRLPPWLLTLALMLPSLAASTVSETRIAALTRDAERELRENLLSFWLRHAPAGEDGFHAVVGGDLSVRDDVPRGSLMTSRILWTFSAAYERFHDPAYLAMAQRAYRDLTKRFVDPEHGGVYWTIDPQGRPLDARKQIYGQVFAIYGLSEYHRATGDQDALKLAIDIYRRIETHASDRVHGGYFDALDREWRRLPDASNLLGRAPKSQNSHIHILEGFTGLLRVWPDPELRRRHRELIELMLTRIVDTRTHHLVLFMQDDWTPIGEEVSYGHDIELSWLVVEAAEVAGDPALLDRARKEAVAITDVTLAEGLDKDGGIFSSGGPNGITHHNKGWWDQAEAVVGFINAHQIAGGSRYFDAAEKCWQFIQERFVDRKVGEWHSSIRPDGSPAPSGNSDQPSPKISLWKCCYHSGRACLQILERFEHAAAQPAAPKAPAKS